VNLLLHACCGPCLIEPLDALRADHDVDVAYANPNIHPRAEYALRRTTLEAYARAQDARVVELPYDPAAWVRLAGPVADRRHERCRACFRLRLGAVAERARGEGYDGFATTLTVSPFQDVTALREAADEVAEAYDVAYLHTDFREAYPESVRRSRELGMYRQNYCGCLMSRIEAARERAQRRAERSAAKAAREG
jgi:predicted adenine nucleotide alpha hydrolase (AANH) superfamily ATPase